MNDTNGLLRKVQPSSAARTIRRTLESEGRASFRRTLGLAPSGALPMYKVLKLVNYKFLIADYAFYQITDRNYSN